METSPHIILDAATYSIDDKGRVSLPAGFRYQCSVGGQGPFILTIGADHCLAVYPVEEWRRLVRFITPRFLGLTRQTFARFIRWLFASTTLCQADVQGRIRIPQPLLDWAKLSREATIVAIFNRLELWNPVEQKRHIGSEDDFADALSRLQFDTMTFGAEPDGNAEADAALAGLPVPPL